MGRRMTREGMEISTVAVIGAGTMGAGIAQVCAQAGWRTHLHDAHPDGLAAGMERISAFWDKGIARGKTTEEQKAAWSAHLHAVSDLGEAVATADLVVEAVPFHSVVSRWLHGGHRCWHRAACNVGRGVDTVRVADAGMVDLLARPGVVVEPMRTVHGLDSIIRTIVNT